MAEQTPDTDIDQKKKEDSETEAKDPRQKSRRRFIIILVVAVLIVGALLWYWRSTFYEDTDDAQINGNLIQLSSRINGNVVAVNFDENSHVKAGQVLVQLDPTDYQNAVRQDEANLTAAEANLESAKVNIPVSRINSGTNINSAAATVGQANQGVVQAQHQLQADQAQVAQAQANYTKAKLDVERYTPLVQRDIISKQQYDQAVATANADMATVNQAQQNVTAAEANVHIMRDKVTQTLAQLQYAKTGPDQVKIQRAKADQAEAQVEQAQAQLAQAKLNLSYCRIVAPANGIVASKSIQAGQNVAVGQNMATLASLDDIWVTANFKETQLDHMRAGQRVTFSVDAYGGRKYDGVVTQIGGATGSVLSLFPPENATGNYVKVVQRVPVRIDLKYPSEDKDHLLRPGMSVEPKVRIKN